MSPSHAGDVPPLLYVDDTHLGLVLLLCFICLSAGMDRGL